MRIGIQLTSLRQPLKTALQTAARLGAETVNINARTRTAAPSAFGYRAAAAAQNAWTISTSRWAASSFPRDMATTSKRTSIDASKPPSRRCRWPMRMGTSVVINSVGFIPEPSEGVEWDLLVAALSDIGRHGQKCGAMLAARTGPLAAPALRRLLDALPAGSLAVSLDPGQLSRQWYSADEALQLSDPRHPTRARSRRRPRPVARTRRRSPAGTRCGRFSHDLGHADQANYRGSSDGRAARIARPDHRNRQCGGVSAAVAD